jgi:hypothetical protein
MRYTKYLLTYEAQQLGLEPKPPDPLSKQEWKQVAQKSNTRQDSSRPCPICKEEFGLATQVGSIIITL